MIEDKIFFSNKTIVVTESGVLNMDDAYEDTYHKVVPIDDVENPRAEWHPPWQGAGFASVLAVGSIYFGFWIAGLAFAAIAGMIWKISRDGQVVYFSEKSGNCYMVRMSHEDAKKAVEAIAIANRSEAERREEISNIDLDELDVGSPDERYKRAVEYWDKKDPASQDIALQIYERLTVDGVPFDKPYLVYSTILSMTDERANSAKLVYLAERLYEISPDDPKTMDNLQYRNFVHAQVLWDSDEKQQAFEYHLKNLHLFSSRGGVLSNEAPLHVRVAFLACRMFSKEALEEENTDLGVAFMGWCEVVGIDMNKEIDISDAKR